MKSLASWITRKLIQENVIEANEYEIYHYGIQLILSTAWIFTWMLGIGIVIGRVHLSIVFILALAGLRHYTGGYHANAYYKCFLVSVGTFIATIIMVYIQERWHLKYSLVICSLICVIGLCRIGSLNSEKNPKTADEMHYRKQLARLISCLYSVVSCFLIVYVHKYLDLATILICIQIIARLALGINTREGGKRNEKSSIKRNC